MDNTALRLFTGQKRGATIQDFLASPAYALRTRNLRPSTKRGHAEAIAHWNSTEGLACFPIAEVAYAQLAAFDEALKTRTWSRGLAGKPRPLSTRSRAKLLTNLLAILRIAHTEGILGATTMPTIEKPRPSKRRPKPSFPIDDVRAIWRHAHEPPADRCFDRLEWPVPPAQLLPVFIAALFYTGLRVGTLLALEFDHLRKRRDSGRYARAVYFDIPGSIVKTGQDIEKLAHEFLVEQIESIRQPARRLVFPVPCCRRHLLTIHQRIVAAAGADPSLTLHAWRRTHLTEMGRLGMSYGPAMAAQAAGHASTTTTTDHYVDFEDLVIPLLPRLDVDDAPPPAVDTATPPPQLPPAQASSPPAAATTPPAEAQQEQPTREPIALSSPFNFSIEATL